MVIFDRCKKTEVYELNDAEHTMDVKILKRLTFKQY